jgi:hypothetical protein
MLTKTRHCSSINWTRNLTGQATVRCLAVAVLLLAGALAAQAQTSGDPYPYQAVAFFNTQSCPNGWTPFTFGDGYFVVPTMQSGGIGSTVGTALTSQQNPQHTHKISSSISLGNAKYVGIAGCCNDDVTSDGTKSFSGTSGAGSSNIPYVQYLVCMKETMPTSDPLPSGVVSFFGALFCPTGWTQTLTTAGRFLVGLPQGGAPGSAFGGDPLLPMEDRTHTHSFNGSVSTSSAGVGLASGCCAEGYGLNGSYKYSGTSGASSSGLPYVQLLQCQKN